MRYRVIRSENENEFVHEVNQALADGWRLQGGVSLSTCATPDDGRMASYVAWTWAQALIRDSEETGDVQTDEESDAIPPHLQHLADMV